MKNSRGRSAACSCTPLLPLLESLKMGRSRTESSFANGEYLVLNVSGHVTVQLTDVAGADCDLSGLFFDQQWPT